MHYKKLLRKRPTTHGMAKKRLDMADMMSLE